MSGPGKDALGTRMKNQYEFRARHYLPRRSYTIVRLDGRAFHSYTRGLARPFDQQFMDDMAATAVHLCSDMAGTQFAYTQSDEISLLLTDFATIRTEAWFDGNIQKIVSIAAAIATGVFNRLRPSRPLAGFDARCFTIPDPTEVANYFVWRQKDCTRNSISMAAQAHFSAKQLHGKSCDQMQEMLWAEAGVNWSEYPDRFKNGTIVSKAGIWETRDVDLGQEHIYRHHWDTMTAPMFTKTNWLATHIPLIGDAE